MSGTGGSRAGVGRKVKQIFIELEIKYSTTFVSGLVFLLNRINGNL